jgi:hypothetical protein
VWFVDVDEGDLIGEEVLGFATGDCVGEVVIGGVDN